MGYAAESSKSVFDGVQPITLCTPEPESAIELYASGLGFTAQPPVEWSAEPWRALWGLPPGGDLVVTDLVKEGAHGGGIRIVRSPELPVVSGGRRPDVCGPYAWDFYVRDMSRTIERVQALGWTLRSEPQRYRLFGQNFEVLECMLEGPQGLLHALVEYIPDRHRCVLGTNPSHEVSEVVATVFVVPAIAEPLTAMTLGLNSDVAMDEVFSGPEIETLLDLPAGSSFRMALMRGPSRRSARFELLECLIGARGITAGYPHVVAPIPVADPPAAASSVRGHLAGTTYSGSLEGVAFDLAPGVRVLLVPDDVALT